jgi:hypothetical protein
MFILSLISAGGSHFHPRLLSPAPLLESLQASLGSSPSPLRRPSRPEAAGERRPPPVQSSLGSSLVGSLALCRSGVMPCIRRLWWPELSSCSLPVVETSLPMLLHWLEPKMDGAISSAPPLNKLVGALLRAVLPRSGRHGGGRRRETTRSGVPGVFLEASLGEEHQQRRGCAAATSGQWGLFAPWSLMLQRIFFLQAREPRRIYFDLTAALHADLAPSGFVPGDDLGGRGNEVQATRRWRRTRSLFLFSSRVLFRIWEGHAVTSFTFRVLCVSCTHRYK